MKKIYLFSLVLTVLTSAAGAQTKMTTDQRMGMQNPQKSKAPVTKIRATAANQKFISCDSLTTTYMGGNGNSGIMFNIQALQKVVVTGFHVSINSTAGVSTYIKLYYRKGTYIGNETNPASWTFIDSTQVVSGGSGVPVYVPVNTSIVIPAGTKYGFYVTTNSGISLDYTDGTNEDSIYVANSYFNIREGHGMGYPFITSGVPRIFNGSVHFCPEISVKCDTINTTFVGGNGYDGNMFDVAATQNIVLDRIYSSVSGQGWMKIYYKPVTYVGAETTPAAWTLIDSAYVSPLAGVNPTLLSIPLNLPVIAGQSIGLYVTGNGSGASLVYTDGTLEGNVYVSDGNIQIKEGKGLGYPFATNYAPRVYNGIIDYCLLGGSGIKELKTSEFSFYPNPVTTQAVLELKNGIVTDNAELVVYDVLGKPVQQINGINTDHIQIEKGNLQAGVYFYRLSQQGKNICKGSFVIE